MSTAGEHQGPETGALGRLEPSKAGAASADLGEPACRGGAAHIIY